MGACFHTNEVTCDNCNPRYWKTDRYEPPPVANLPLNIVEYKGPFPPAVFVDGGMKDVVQRLDTIIEKLDILTTLKGKVKRRLRNVQRTAK